jgi:hypothetical protein
MITQPNDALRKPLVKDRLYGYTQVSNGVHRVMTCKYLGTVTPSGGCRVEVLTEDVYYCGELSEGFSIGSNPKRNVGSHCLFPLP